MHPDLPGVRGGSAVAVPVDPEAERAALAADPLLAGLPADRRATLLAVAEAAGSPAGSLAGGGPALRFDVRLQGPGETVFLQFPRHREPGT